MNERFIRIAYDWRSQVEDGLPAVLQERLDSKSRTRPRHAGRVESAKARLNELWQRGGAFTSQITAAEQRVASTRTRTRTAAAADRLQSVEQRLASLRASGGTAEQIATAEQRVETARTRAVNSAGANTVAEQRLEEIRSPDSGAANLIGDRG